jgi:hypothetical protein
MRWAVWGEIQDGRNVNISTTTRPILELKLAIKHNNLVTYSQILLREEGLVLCYFKFGLR